MLRTDPVALPDLCSYWSGRPAASIVIRVKGFVCTVLSIVSLSNHRLSVERSGRNNRVHWRTVWVAINVTGITQKRHLAKHGYLKQNENIKTKEDFTSSGALISAPWPISCEISSRCPLAAARCMAVRPTLSLTWSCNVDLLSKILTTSEWPFSALKCKGIEPYKTKKTKTKKQKKASLYAKPRECF